MTQSAWPESPLVSAEELSGLVAEGSALIFDCRFDLKHPGQGFQSYLSAHLPGAHYANLDDNLSGRVTRRSGRHPVPFPRSFASFLARSGFTPKSKVVAYDAHGGAFASRLWWLMKYFGLGCTAVLDGGIGAWMKAGYPMDSGEVSVERQSMPELRPHPGFTLNSQGVANAFENGEIRLVDARAKDRFEGENETIDPVAGHVPGAINRPFQANLTDLGRFRESTQLRNEFRKLMGKMPPERVVHMCGSGVTACHNLLSMELAGLPGSKLFTESWSGWITDPKRPVALGPG